MKGRRARDGITHARESVAELGVARELAGCGIEHAGAASRRTDGRRAAAAFGAQRVDDGGRDRRARPPAERRTPRSRRGFARSHDEHSELASQRRLACGSSYKRRAVPAAAAHQGRAAALCFRTLSEQHACSFVCHAVALRAFCAWHERCKTSRRRGSPQQRTTRTLNHREKRSFSMNGFAAKVRYPPALLGGGLLAARAYAAGTIDIGDGRTVAIAPACGPRRPQQHDRGSAHGRAFRRQVQISQNQYRGNHHENQCTTPEAACHCHVRGNVSRYRTGTGHDQGRHPAFAVRHDGDQRDDSERHDADDDCRSERQRRPARQEARSRRRRPGLRLAAVRREGARAHRGQRRRRRVRLLDVRVAQIRAARVRGAQQPAVLSRAVRRRGVVEERVLHGRGAEPASDSRPSTT